MSGYKMKYEGQVVSGNRIGHTIGVPTINIPVNENDNAKLPPYGVYTSRVLILDELNNREYSYCGIANLGVKPTVDANGQSNPLGIEVNLFDFSGDLYDARVKLELIDYIRTERKFADIDELKRQIEMDIIKAKKLLGLD